MLNFKIALIVGMMLVASSAFAGTIYLMGIGTGSPFVAPPPIAGALMLEDGASFLLLEDNSSHICLEGGC